MYLHLGNNYVIPESDIIGIFDMDNTTISKHTRKLLNLAEKSGKVTAVTNDLPKSFVQKRQRIFMSDFALSACRTSRTEYKHTNRLASFFERQSQKMTLFLLCRETGAKLYKKTHIISIIILIICKKIYKINMAFFFPL